MEILLFVVGLIAIALITVLILLVVRHVVAPLTHISNNITAMSEGDFTIEVDSSSNDEIGLMGSKVSEFVASMKTIPTGFPRACMRHHSRRPKP